MATEPARTYPSELPVLALRQSVVFPLTLQPLAVNRPLSIEAVNRALASDRLLFLTLQNTDKDEPEPGDLRTIGTIAAIRQMAKVPNGGIHIIVEGLVRAKSEVVTKTETTLRGTVSPMPEVVERSLEIDAYVRRLHELIERALSLATGLSQELRGMVAGIDDPLRLAYLLASLLDMKPEEKQQILEDNTLTGKLQATSNALGREIALLEMKSKIESTAQQEMTDAQRQYYLRQQLKAIQDELGEGEKTEITDLRKRLADAKLPEAVATVAERELERLARMTPASPEYQMIRTYFDWVLDIPCSTLSPDRLDPVAARQVLDQDHYDLDKVKERIVEYLAVRKLKGDMKGPILCFVGPPGVGKTSLGQSIARAMDRKFVRISLGGVRDEAEVRGHRRTYVGALPGRIVRAIKEAGSMNPVVLLDEIDKVGSDYRGDPAAALLEVLDPAQNHTFRDHYLEVELDLSDVVFLATANVLEAIPEALLDRMELVRLDGYTEDEKVVIARDHLLPRQLERSGLEPGEVVLEEASLRKLAGEYTREAGVRTLERAVARLLRKIAAQHELGDRELPFTVTPEDLRALIGRPHHVPESAQDPAERRTAVPGVATGLAVTGAGGDVLFVEASLADPETGAAGLTLTGQLGDVMKESAQIALSFLRSHGAELELPVTGLKDRGAHIHFPAGAVPKDGPSAGITMTTALASLLSGRLVRTDVAMTGEVSLTGRVLPIGGLKQKLLAAHRAGITTVIIPKRNEADLDDVPAEVLEKLEVHPVTDVRQVLELALAPAEVPVAVAA